MRLLTLILISLVSGGSLAQKSRNKNCPATIHSVVPTVSFCDLSRDPARYNGKVIRTRARYLVGGETRILYDKRCRGDAWVQFDNFFRNCTNPKLLEKLSARKHPPGVGLFNGTADAEIIAVGRFMHDGAFGHMGAYKYEFTINWIEKVGHVTEK